MWHKDAYAVKSYRWIWWLLDSFARQDGLISAGPTCQLEDLMNVCARSNILDPPGTSIDILRYRHVSSPCELNCFSEIISEPLLLIFLIWKKYDRQKMLYSYLFFFFQFTKKMCFLTLLNMNNTSPPRISLENMYQFFEK